jgi:hypothetical protein
VGAGPGGPGGGGGWCGLAGWGLGAAEPFPGEQDEPVDEQEHRRGGGLGEDGPEGVLEGDAGEPDRDGGYHDHPRQPLIGVVCAEAVFAQPAQQAGEQAADDPRPVGAEEPQQGQRGGAVQGDDVGQVERGLAAGLGGLGDHGLPAAADPGRDQDRVAQAGDWEQLGYALDNGDDECLQVRHCGSSHGRGQLRPPGPCQG